MFRNAHGRSWLYYHNILLAKGISNTRGNTVPQESWGKSPKVCARVTRPFRPGGYESVKGLSRETRRSLLPSRSSRFCSDSVGALTQKLAVLARQGKYWTTGMCEAWLDPLSINARCQLSILMFLTT